MHSQKVYFVKYRPQHREDRKIARYRRRDVGLEGRGKRGGTRVIYFYHSADIPLFALSAYAKNDRADLSQKDRNDFQQLTKLLVEAYRGTKR
jgi:hypothetical protein